MGDWGSPFYLNPGGDKTMDYITIPFLGNEIWVFGNLTVKDIFSSVSTQTGQYLEEVPEHQMIIIILDYGKFLFWGDNGPWRFDGR
ncbi:MAG: hypothetical protein CM15mV24_0010 [Bellamyvirus sp.]|nr:MAG: hypothetical protein CM15mV24_0010 [Bellamyvirus sp.]